MSRIPLVTACASTAPCWRQPGVPHSIIMLGTNDLRKRWGHRTVRVRLTEESRA